MELSVDLGIDLTSWKQLRAFQDKSVRIQTGNKIMPEKTDLIDLNKTDTAVEWLCQTSAAAAEAADANWSRYTKPNLFSFFFFVLWTLDPCFSNWPQSRESKRRGERFIQIKEKIWQWSVWTSQSCSAAPAKIMNCSAHSLASVIGNFEVGCGGSRGGGAALIRSNSVSYTTETHSCCWGCFKGPELTEQNPNFQFKHQKQKQLTKI